MLLEILKAILFGIVEGITEWLPISSTGHMILLDQVVKLNVSADFYKMFQVVISPILLIAGLLPFFAFSTTIKTIPTTISAIATGIG